MATEIIMPSVSTSMTEGILARWLKNEGDAVDKGEIVAEIETDKAVLELEAEAAGVLARRYVEDGACVAVGAPMGIILQAGEALPAAPVAASPAQPAAPAPTAPPAAAPEAKAPADAGGRGGRIFASPLARNLALRNGVDLAQVRGSGPNGRIVRRDVEAARLAQQAAAASPASAPAAAPAAARSHEEIPHSSMRRVIAQRLSESKQRIPHFYLSIDVALDALLALRRQVNDALPEVRVSVNDFIVKAVAGAMKKVPMANASWTESAIHRHRSVDVSVAVATPSGLITPVVRDADRKSLGAVSAEVKDLAERARQGKLLPDEYQGGGFTISNLGMFGVREFAAIINPPQACILAVGAGEARAVVRDGAVVAATVMSCTLSVDHRVVDGAVGAEFLAAFKSGIEQPMSLLV